LDQAQQLLRELSSVMADDVEGIRALDPVGDSVVDPVGVSAPTG
jgi:hypothetical protein